MSKRSDSVRLAHSKGYVVRPDGRVVGVRGNYLKLKIFDYNGKKYYHFNVACEDGVRRPVAVHKLMAYQKFGEDSLKEGIVTRHANDDSLDNRESNILIGTLSDNIMDIPKAVRKRSAQKAGRTNSQSEEFWDKVREDHNRGLSYNDLIKKYGLSKGTLSYRLSSTAKRRLQPLED